MKAGAILAGQLRETRRWTLLLLEDFKGEDWTFQPAPGAQHALWLCGHLACAQDLLVFQRCLGEPATDPEFAAHFPIGSDVPSREASGWPSVERVRTFMDSMQARVEAAVAEMDDAFLAQPATGKDGAAHPHYHDRLGLICHLNRHEAFHTGQIAIIRRLLGKRFLR
jgi:hypothetical protein